MTTFNIISASDHRWTDLVSCHSQASVFHTSGWLQALNRAYGYEPLVVTSTPAGKPLTDGVVLCGISSWLTGPRAVSLPFADHCEPLLNEGDDSGDFTAFLQSEQNRTRWKYIELRPLQWKPAPGSQLRCGRSFCFHTLDLSPSSEQLFEGLHKDSFQRRIRRAEKAKLSYHTGRSTEIVDEFYQLVLRTRKRQRLIPQPRAWFQNLVECMGDHAQLRIARKDGRTVAGMLTLQYRSTVVYKYGASDERLHNLGGVPFLFWRLIEESKHSGLAEIDLGRSDWDNTGLIAFKDRLGAARRTLTYFRYAGRAEATDLANWTPQSIRKAVSLLPNGALSAAGKIFYRHLG